MTTRVRAGVGVKGASCPCERLAPQQNPHKANINRDIFDMTIA
jgi:hypothetical protein